ncbi:Helix-turn-helix domain protein [Corynebacterium ciconiae DSM 44920]|uniref:helix-turn-helix domain-containing protein n=1 Tax=Corynebacterium ciconiae TaxID=227319 RepID=UPI00037F9697|nr:helix-turn-helix transcriptional regulator [Corynebacterium ciconiae]WKD60699.1 Helix-turn-helix domain protein [Corynebacterium ciconiae DSM 44920]
MRDAADLGRRLHHARLDRQLSQAELARGVCSPSSISRWERGCGFPPPEILSLLAERLGITLHTLTGRGFDPHTAESPEGVVTLIHTAFGDPTADPHASPTAVWMHSLARISWLLDPWVSHTRLSVQDVQNQLCTLHNAHLAQLTPTTAESLSILDALSALRSTPRAAEVQQLVQAIAQGVDAPAELRRRALDVVVASYLLAGMPVAAAEAVGATELTAVSLSTSVMLQANGGGDCEGVRVSTRLTRRDHELTLAAGGMSRSTLWCSDETTDHLADTLRSARLL